MYKDIETIIPHRFPMIMIDGYHKTDSDTAWAEKTFRQGDYGLSNGYVIESVLIECVAQTVAAHFGYKAVVEDHEKNQIKKGMLVSVDSFSFINQVPEKSLIKIHIRKTNELGAFKMYRGKIERKGSLVAEGDLKLFVSEEM